MGQMDGTDELVLKILGDGGFDIADAVGQGLGFGSFVQVEKGDPGAVAGGVLPAGCSVRPRVGAQRLAEPA